MPISPAVEIPPEYAYLQQNSLEFQRRKFLAEDNIAGTGRTFPEKVVKVYGSLQLYEAFKASVSFNPEQAHQFERYNILLQPMQMRFAYWARRADDEDGPREIALGGARGPGKSYAVLTQAAIDDCQRFPGLKVLYLRRTATAAAEQFQDLIVAVLGTFPGAKVTGARIRFPNGSVIIVGGFKDDAQALGYQGVEYDLLIIEEATQLSQHTYTTLRLSERSSKVFKGKVWRPRTYVTFNPMGIGHKFFKQRFVDPQRAQEADPDHYPRDPERVFIEGRVTDNLFVNPDYIRNLKELVGAERRAYLEGDWDVSAGAYFETFRRDIHVLRRPIREVDWMRKLYLGMDYGFGHWNMTYLAGVDGDGYSYAIHELAHRHKRPEQIAPDIYAMLTRYNLTPADLDARRIGSDAFNKTGLSEYSIAEQYRKLGIKFQRAETAPGSRIGRAQWLNQALGDPRGGKEPTLFISPYCPMLADCIPFLEHAKHDADDVEKWDADDDGNGGDDPYDGLCYTLFNPRATRTNLNAKKKRSA